MSERSLKQRIARIENRLTEPLQTKPAAVADQDPQEPNTLPTEPPHAATQAAQHDSAQSTGEQQTAAARVGGNPDKPKTRDRWLVAGDFIISVVNVLFILSAGLALLALIVSLALRCR